MPQRLRYGHQCAREKVHGVGKGDLRRGEKNVADLPIRERLDDEGHGFAGLLTPAREIEIGEAVEQRLEHRRDLVGEADPKAAHLRSGERELVADVIEERRVAGEDPRLGADLVGGIAKTVGRKEREQLRPAAPEQLHRNRRALRWIAHAIDRGPKCAELLGGCLFLQFLKLDPQLRHRSSRRIAMQRLRQFAKHRPDVLRRLARIGELLLQHDEVTYRHAGIG